MNFFDRFGRFVTLPGLLLIACTPTSRRPETPPLQAATTTAPAEIAPRPPSEPHDGTPGKVACAATHCDAAKEVCCGKLDDNMAAATQACAARDEGAKAVMARLDHEYDVAEGTCLALNATVASTCDESSDCATGLICCPTSVNAFHHVKRCAKSCEQQEVCRQGTCRTPDTVCDDGECRQKSVRIACGAETCDAKARYCRVMKDPPHEKKCEPSPKRDPEVDVLECRTKHDCAAGHYCNVGMGGTWCSGRPSDASYTITCERDEDCVGVDLLVPLATPRRCKPYGIDDLKGCLGN